MPHTYHLCGNRAHATGTMNMRLEHKASTNVSHHHYHLNFTDITYRINNVGGGEGAVLWVNFSFHFPVWIGLNMGKLKCWILLHTYKGGPKNNENFFYGGERGRTSVCSRLVRVRDCPLHQLAKRHPWGKVRVIFFLSLCHCFCRFFDGRLKRTKCLHHVLFLFGENSSRNCHNASRGF